MSEQISGAMRHTESRDQNGDDRVVAEPPAYELSSGQVADLIDWMENWDPCPWCDREKPVDPGTRAEGDTLTHAADCLFADICRLPMETQ